LRAAEQNNLKATRALVRDEWRAQRCVWAALLGLSLALAILARFSSPVGKVRDYMLLAIPFAWGGIATLLGVTAFGGEGYRNFELSPDGSHVSRHKRFFVKIAVVAVLLLAAQTLTSALMPNVDWSGETFDYDHYFRYYIYFSFACGMLLISLAAACVASWSKNARTAIVQTAVIGTCLILWMAWMGKLFCSVIEYQFSNDLRARFLAFAAMVVLAHGVLILAGWLLWTAKRGGALRQFVHAALFLITVVFAMTAPVVASYLWCTLKPSLLQVPCRPDDPSPGGRYVLCPYHWTEGWLKDGCFILDTAKSRAVALSRFHENEAIGGWWSETAWSPDGSKFLFFVNDDWACPLLVKEEFPRLFGEGGKLCWADAATGEATVLRVSHRVSFGTFVAWWLNDHTAAFREGPGIVFKDLRNGERKFCADPRLAGANRVFSDVFVGRAAANGIWTLADLGGGEFNLICYQPGSAGASVERLHWHFDSDKPLLSALSPDGRWALLDYCPQYPGSSTRLLCALETGEAHDIDNDLASDESAKGVRVISSFTHDSRALLAGNGCCVGLWNLAKRKFDVLWTQGSLAHNWERGFDARLSPSGKYVLVTVGPRVVRGARLSNELESFVIEIAPKRSWSVLKTTVRAWDGPMWLGDDWLLAAFVSPNVPDSMARIESNIWLISRDGVSKRKLFQ
jgi:hypothetical protein